MRINVLNRTSRAVGHPAPSTYLTLVIVSYLWTDEALHFSESFQFDLSQRRLADHFTLLSP